MRSTLSAAGQATTEAAPTCGSDEPFTPTSESEDWDWFAPVAWHVLGPKDAGAILHEITRYPISTCRAYVAKERSGRRAPTTQFLRILFHSKVGQPFLDGFMRGCTQPWWIEAQRAQSIGEQVLEITSRE